MAERERIIAALAEDLYWEIDYLMNNNEDAMALARELAERALKVIERKNRG